MDYYGNDNGNQNGGYSHDPFGFVVLSFFYG